MDLLNKIELMLEELQVYQEPVQSQLTQTVAGVLKDLFDDPVYKKYSQPMQEQDFNVVFEKDFKRILSVVSGSQTEVNNLPSNFTLKEFKKAGTPSNLVAVCMYIKKANPNLDNAQIKKLLTKIVANFFQQLSYSQDKGAKVKEVLESVKVALGKLGVLSQEQLFRVVTIWGSNDAEIKNYLQNWEKSNNTKVKP